MKHVFRSAVVMPRFSPAIAPMWLQVLAAAALTISVPALSQGQQIYKCTSKNGVIEYSQQPCQGQTMKVLTPDKGPSEAEVRRNQARVAAEIERSRAQEEAATRVRAANKAAEMQLFKPAPTINGNDPSNEKALVHTPEGWDYKSRNGPANEKVLVHTPDGWDHKTRAEIAADEQRKAERRRNAAQAPAPTPAPPCAFVGDTNCMQITTPRTCVGPNDWGCVQQP